MKTSLRAPPRGGGVVVLPPGAAIACRALTRVFEGRVAVDALDLDVPRGAIFALLGPNGAGKTTTVRMLAGLIAPTSGRASVVGYAVGEDDDALHASIGILTETPGLYERLTPDENLAFFGRLHGLDEATTRQRTDELLERLDLSERRDEPVAGFSKGMKQKVAIARALLHRPEVLFLDEPTSGLDPEAAFEIRRMIVDLKQRGTTILLTTHRLEEAEELADLIGIFKTRLLVADTLAGLRARVGAHRVAVRLASVDEAWLFAARASSGVTEASWEEGRLLATVEDADRDTPCLVRALVDAGADVRSVEPLVTSLEAIYLDLVGRAA